eukprot:GGOE01014550.1.p1 GENE.GGOE01014550.1~~GGOE01014550.1.p1  ORF type:complete len:843 (-),score=129.83 GGOE01014550.1:45-2573(-)
MFSPSHRSRPATPNPGAEALSPLAGKEHSPVLRSSGPANNVHLRPNSSPLERLWDVGERSPLQSPQNHLRSPDLHPAMVKSSEFIPNCEELEECEALSQFMREKGTQLPKTGKLECRDSPKDWPAHGSTSSRQPHSLLAQPPSDEVAFRRSPNHQSMSNGRSTPSTASANCSGHTGERPPNYNVSEPRSWSRLSVVSLTTSSTTSDRGAVGSVGTAISIGSLPTSPRSPRSGSQFPLARPTMSPPQTQPTNSPPSSQPQSRGTFVPFVDPDVMNQDVMSPSRGRRADSGKLSLASGELTNNSFPPERPKRKQGALKAIPGPLTAQAILAKHGTYFPEALYEYPQEGLDPACCPPTPMTGKGRKLGKMQPFDENGLGTLFSPRCADALNPSASHFSNPLVQSCPDLPVGRKPEADMEEAGSSPIRLAVAVPAFQRRRPQSLCDIFFNDCSSEASQADDPMAAHEIIPNLLLGPQSFANNYNRLKAARITHVLVVGRHLKPLFPQDFVYQVMDALEDQPDQEILSIFPKCFSFLDVGRQEPNRVLVHCNAGVSRSPSVVIGYVMKLFGFSFQKAYDLVHSKRNVVCPNPGFARQLKSFDRMKCVPDGDTDQHMLHCLKFCHGVEAFDMARWQHLQSLTLPDDSDLTDAHTLVLLQLPHLTSLDFSNAYIGDHGLQHLSRHSRLEALHLRGTNCTDATILAINPVCPLAVVSVPPHVTNRSAHFISKTFASTLTEVDLAFSEITDEGLMQIVKKCHGMLTLTVAHMPHISEGALEDVEPSLMLITDQNYPFLSTWERVKCHPIQPKPAAHHGNPFRQRPSLLKAAEVKVPEVDCSPVAVTKSMSL